MKTKVFLLVILLFALVSCKSYQPKTSRIEQYQDELFQGKITSEEYVYLIRAENELKTFTHEN